MRKCKNDYLLFDHTEVVLFLCRVPRVLWAAAGGGGSGGGAGGQRLCSGLSAAGAPHRAAGAGYTAAAAGQGSQPAAAAPAAGLTGSNIPSHTVFFFI